MFLTASKSITSLKYFAQCLLPSMDELIVPNTGHPHSRAQPAMTTRSTTLGLSPPPSWFMELQTTCTSKTVALKGKTTRVDFTLLLTVAWIIRKWCFVSQTWSNNNFVWFSAMHKTMYSQFNKVTNTIIHHENENERGLKRSMFAVIH